MAYRDLPTSRTRVRDTHETLAKEERRTSSRESGRIFEGCERGESVVRNEDDEIRSSKFEVGELLGVGCWVSLGWTMESVVGEKGERMSVVSRAVSQRMRRGRFAMKRISIELVVRGG